MDQPIITQLYTFTFTTLLHKRRRDLLGFYDFMVLTNFCSHNWLPENKLLWERKPRSALNWSVRNKSHWSVIWAIWRIGSVTKSTPCRWEIQEMQMGWVQAGRMTTCFFIRMPITKNTTSKKQGSTTNTLIKGKLSYTKIYIHTYLSSARSDFFLLIQQDKFPIQCIGERLINSRITSRTKHIIPYFKQRSSAFRYDVLRSKRFQSYQTVGGKWVEMLLVTQSQTKVTLQVSGVRASCTHHCSLWLHWKQTGRLTFDDKFLRQKIICNLFCGTAIESFSCTYVCLKFLVSYCSYGLSFCIRKGAAFIYCSLCLLLLHFCKLIWVSSIKLLFYSFTFLSLC